MRLNQVTVPCIDYAASVAFYKTLGLIQIVDSPPRYARFECPDADGGEPATFSLHHVEGWQGCDDPLIYFTFCWSIFIRTNLSINCWCSN